MVNRISIPSIILLLFGLGLQAQPIYKLKSSKINFFAGTPVEDIDGNNTNSISFINLKTGEVTISIPVKQFKFKRALMEEHFNENYLESDKYPECVFKGKIAGIEKLDLNAKEPFKTTITGNLTLHGVTKERTIDVTILPKGGTLVGDSKFLIALADHKIDRPQIVWEKLAENVQVTTNFIYEPLQK
jgi:hypothetical protein